MTVETIDMDTALAVAPKAANLPAVPQTGSLIQAIAAAASDPQVDIEKMERLWAMHERMTNRSNEEAFNSAMSRAQAEMRPISTDATNPQTRSRYATYAKLDNALRPIYTKHGFSVSFDNGEGAPEGHVRVLAYVSHSGGHSRTYHCDMPADGKGAKGGDVMTKTHASGSAMSYGMRYLLKMVFNVAVGETDDDGNGGSDGDDQSPVGKVFDALCALVEASSLDVEAHRIWTVGNRVLQVLGAPEAAADFKDRAARHRKALAAK
jgi:hypothetical protein